MGRDEQAPGAGSDLDGLVAFEQTRDLMETPPGVKPGTDPELLDLVSEAAADRFKRVVQAPSDPEELAAEDRAIADLQPGDE